MNDTLSKLIEVLKKDERLVVDGKLAKNKVVELALELDVDLLKLLKQSSEVKKVFFQEVDGVLVFDKAKFQSFVSNKQFLPDSFTEYKNKIGLMAGKQYLTDSSEVVLAFPHKDCVLEGGQDKDDAKRDEVFWNETLAPDEIDRLLKPKTLTNIKKYTNGKEAEVGDITMDDNLVLKGNNLLCLHTLKRRYQGKIKLIYIDPPYNPDTKSNTFIYNNTFNESTWLVFMKNRLEIAKKLLTKDGCLVLAIDENEQAEIIILLKEIFKGYEVHCITVVHNPRGVQGTNFSYTHEYAIFVIPQGQKSIGNRKISSDEVSFSNLRNWGGESERSDAKNCFYPVIVENDEIVDFGDVCSDDFHPKQTEKDGDRFFVYPIDIGGTERKWRYARQSVEEVKHLLRAKKTKSGGYEVEIGKDFGTYKTVWADSRYDANEYGTKIVKSLVPDCKFDFPKSLYNVYDALYAVVGSDKDAIVLDFFGGSGTTAHAVLLLNKDDGESGKRKFIICEQMDYVETVTRERIRKVTELDGQGSFIYAELAKANQNFVDEIQEAKTSKKLESIWTEMKKTAFLSYRVDAKELDDTKGEWQKLSLDEQKNVLVAVLEKNWLYVPYSEIDDERFAIPEKVKKLNHKFYE